MKKIKIFDKLIKYYRTLEGNSNYLVVNIIDELREKYLYNEVHAEMMKEEITQKVGGNFTVTNDMTQNVLGNIEEGLKILEKSNVSCDKVSLKNITYLVYKEVYKEILSYINAEE